MLADNERGLPRHASETRSMLRLAASEPTLASITGTIPACQFAPPKFSQSIFVMNQPSKSDLMFRLLLLLLFLLFSLAQKKTEPNAISHFVANIHILELCTVFFASSIIHLTFVFNFDFIDWSNMMRLTSFFHCRLKNTHRSHYITLSHIVAPFA